MPPFVPYPKIVDRIAAWHADETDRRMLDKHTWIATEKIHGANLCICTDGTEIAVAKRRAVLDPGDPFFGYRRAIAPLVPAVRAVFRQLGNVTWAFVYGELFGGHWRRATRRRAFRRPGPEPRALLRERVPIA